MSVFQVKLNNTEQGLLDQNPLTGGQFATSIQRTIYVCGPNRIYRKLADGDQFTDCNYWKRFAPISEGGSATNEASFIHIVTDDGSVWSDTSAENTYPKVYDLEMEGGSTYTDDTNIVDIVGDTGGYAVFVQIVNTGSQDVRVKVNGLASAIFDLAHGETQVFNAGDLAVNYLAFDNSTSGATTATVQVIMSVRSVCNS